MAKKTADTIETLTNGLLGHALGFAEGLEHLETPKENKTVVSEMIAHARRFEEQIGALVGDALAEEKAVEARRVEAERELTHVLRELEDAQQRLVGG
jgi:hypothetical protein